MGAILRLSYRVCQNVAPPLGRRLDISSPGAREISFGSKLCIQARSTPFIATLGLKGETECPVTDSAGGPPRDESMLLQQWPFIIGLESSFAMLYVTWKINVQAHSPPKVWDLNLSIEIKSSQSRLIFFSLVGCCIIFFY